MPQSGDRPLDLPGLYWDGERQRYFPIASRPKRKAEDVNAFQSTTQTSPDNRCPRAHRSSIASLLASGIRKEQDAFSARSRLLHEVKSRMLTNVYAELDPPLKCHDTQSRLTSFYVAQHEDKGIDVILGDQYGHIHVSRMNHLSRPAALRNHEPDRFDDSLRVFYSFRGYFPIRHILGWKNISAICIAKREGSCVLTILNSHAVGSALRRTVLSSMSGDIFSASVYDKSLTLGSQGKFMLVHDIDNASRQEYDTIHLKSDALSICHSLNTVLVGCRSGEVLLFDVRVPSNQSTTLLGSRFARRDESVTKSGITSSKPRLSSKAITHVQALREWELLVSTSAGDLEMFDRRFATGPRSQPTVVFSGHFNTYLLDLGITVDPEEEYVFAAGRDRRVRGWSLRTGSPVGGGDDRDLLDGTRFATAPHALQVTPSRTGGMRLWVSQSHELRMFHLGKHEA